MKKSDYKKAFDKMEPDVEFKNRLAQRIQNKVQPKTQRKKKFIASFAAGLILLAGTGMIANLYWNDTLNPITSNLPNHTVTEGAVFIPKIQLPKQSNAAANMIGLIVYQGKVYTQTGTHITPESAKQLIGEKIGRTKGNIDEWSSQKEYARELASSIGQIDVYTVKGYDSNFRIMAYEENNGEIQAAFYECLNGIEVKTGADLFNKLNLIGNVQSVRWEEFDSWNNSRQQYKNVQVDAKLDAFLHALNAAKPIEQERLQKEGIYENGDQTQKFVLVKLQDQTEVRLRLFKDGYVKYGFIPVFFKVDEPSFTEMWSSLK